MQLGTHYQNDIKPALQQELNIVNVMAVPKLTKIVVNVGLGEALADKKVLDRVSEQLMVITGQKPAITRSKMSISSFKLRAGEAIGMKVTLRGARMYDFFEKLTRIVLPRVRDFRGIPKKGFDGSGNYNLGISDQTIFPELEYDKIDKMRGLEITFVTTAKNDTAGFALLSKLGLPFEKESK
ncbi:50S ribosomal protein L5 [Candidatus Microgenomates bacterium]|nr:MAG: 50S ribosomal protein L5 [Candidatus Microgenomates bacterium]